MFEPEKTQTTSKGENRPRIEFKGYRSGLILIIPEEGPFDRYLKELSEHLQKANSFFKGAKISLQLGKRMLSKDEETSLGQLFEANGLIFQRGGGEFKTTAKKVRGVAAGFIPSVTLDRTLRSGEKAEYDGNIVIYGDVNPGAEVIAGGDIIVLGRLRGTAHAGAAGDVKARVLALQLNPVQLRIAGLITRDADRSKGLKFNGPEVARIKDGSIIVEKMRFKEVNLFSRGGR